MSKDLLITFVVITRNRAKILGDCLRRIIEQDFPKDQFELIVIDDGSTDGTPMVVRSLQSENHLPVIRYVAQSHQGVNAARNAGVENAGGTYIMFLDDDELAPSDYLTRVWQLLSKNPDIDGVGGPVRDYGGAKLRICSRCSWADVDLPGEGKRIVPRLLGGNMTLTASAFKRVGLFDAAISGRGDETEWFHRAQGLRFFYDPNLWVWHRRDNFDLIELCRHSLVQGLSVPLAQKKTASHYRPKPMRILRAFGHAFIHGCAWGVVLGFREIGALVGYVRLAVIGR